MKNIKIEQRLSSFMDMDNRAIVLHVITRLDPGGSAENTVLSVERVDPTRFDSRLVTGLGLQGEGPPKIYMDRIQCTLQLEPALIRPIQPVTDIKGLWAMIRLLRRLKPDILHLHSAKAGTLGRIAAKLAGIHAKVVYTPHGHVFSGYGGSVTNRIFTVIEKFLVNWSDAIVGLTLDEIREFRSVGAGHPEKFCIIPSGVELKKFYRVEGKREIMRASIGLPENIQVVGFIGRLDYVKGPDLFIETAAKIHSFLPEVHFVIVGDGEMRETLKRRAKLLKLEENIHWLGWKHNTEDYYPALDVFILTSRNEGQGRVLVEAMASELPIVALSSGGVPEVIENGISGIIVPRGDVQAAADSTIELLQNPDKRLQLAVAGKSRAKDKFSVPVMIDRLEQLYSGLMEKRTPASIFGPAE